MVGSSGPDEGNNAGLLQSVSSTPLAHSRPSVAWSTGSSPYPHPIEGVWGVEGSVPVYSRESSPCLRGPSGNALPLHRDSAASTMMVLEEVPVTSKNGAP